MSSDEPSPAGAPPTPDAPPSPAAGEPAAPPATAPADAGAPVSRRRWGLGRRRNAPASGEPEQPTGVIMPAPDPDGATGVIPMPVDEPEGPPAGGGARLRRERSRLMARREEMLFHLGGLTFELHRRGRLTEAVARHRAAQIEDLDEQVRAIDDQLLAIEGERRARRTRTRVVPVGPAESGCCLVCRAVFFDDARFCMQCGTRFAPPAPAEGSHAAGMTAVLPAVGGEPPEQP